MKKTVTKALLKDNYIELSSISFEVRDVSDYCFVNLYGQSFGFKKEEINKLLKHRKLAIVAI